MHFNVPMTLGAKTSFRKKLMEFCPVAFGTLHPLIKEMLLMTGGPPDGVSFRDRSLKMTLDAASVWDDDPAMPRGNRRRAFDNKAYYQLGPLCIR